MSDFDRRDLLVALVALAARAGASGQEAVPTDAGSFGPSRVLHPEDHLTRDANGIERWGGPHGTLATGEAIGLHVSGLPAGTAPPALHRIDHTELTVVVEGTLEYTHDGVTEHAPAGSILYIARGTNHFVRNVGPGTARYVVIQIGGDTKKG